MTPHSEPVAQPAAPVSPEAAAQAAQEEALKKPLLGIDPQGRLFLSLPMENMDEIVARGFVDKARSMILDYYARRAQTRRQLQGGVLKQALGAAADKLGLRR